MNQEETQRLFPILFSSGKFDSQKARLITPVNPPVVSLAFRWCVISLGFGSLGLVPSAIIAVEKRKRTTVL